MARASQLKAKHKNGNGAGMPLAVAAKLSGSAWPTPRSCSAMSANITASAIAKAPRRFPNLETVVALSTWPTPGANDHKGSSAPGQRRGPLDEATENIPAWIPCECCGEFLCTVHRAHAHECGCPPIEEWKVDPYSRTGMHLNPDWVEALMGFPAGWTRTDGPQAAVKSSTNGSRRASRKTSPSDGSG